MSKQVSWATTALSALSLALGYGLSSWWFLAPAAVLVGALWAWGRARRWDWSSWLGLPLFTLLAAAGLLVGVWPGLCLFGLVAALVAWDLDQFARRMEAVDRVEQHRELERRHLEMLLLVTAAGLGTGTAALLLALRFSFLPALLLGIALLVGITQAIGYLRGS